MDVSRNIGGQIKKSGEGGRGRKTSDADGIKVTVGRMKRVQEGKRGEMSRAEVDSTEQEKKARPSGDEENGESKKV